MSDFNDETACDRCGTPTPRLTPPADVELCERCWRAEQQAAPFAARNEAILLPVIAEGLQDPRRI